MWLEMHGGSHWAMFYTNYAVYLQKRFYRRRDGLRGGAAARELYAVYPTQFRRWRQARLRVSKVQADMRLFATPVRSYSVRCNASGKQHHAATSKGCEPARRVAAWRMMAAVCPAG